MSKHKNRSAPVAEAATDVVVEEIADELDPKEPDAPDPDETDTEEPIGPIEPLIAVPDMPCVQELPPPARELAVHPSESEALAILERYIECRDHPYLTGTAEHHMAKQRLADFVDRLRVSIRG